MRTGFLAIVLFALGLGTAAAQGTSGWYGGGIVGALKNDTDLVDGTTPIGGGIVGVMLTPGFGLEAEVAHGFRTLLRDFGFGNSVESTDRLVVSGRAVWRYNGDSRVRAAVYAGGTFSFHEDVSIVGDTRRDTSAIAPGVTGGVMVPISITRQFSVAPDVRLTFGSHRGEPAFMTGAGVRLLWGF
jgi:hypothetical protein